MRNLWIRLNLRQLIGSSGGKELVQVTRLILERRRSGLTRTASFEVSVGRWLAFVIDLKFVEFGLEKLSFLETACIF